MSLIVKGDKKKQNQQRQIYTWAACIFVALFLISVAVPLLSGGDNDRSAKYKDSYYDLANMPFTSDAAEAELLASARYNDIAKSDLLNTLFGKKEKEARQAEDLEFGPPAPPDEDYKQAVVQKEAQTRSAVRKTERAAAAAKTAQNTRVGSLSKGGGLSGGSGGSSGVSGSIWKGDPNANKKGSANTAAGAGKGLTAEQLSKDLKAGARGSSYFNAYEKSLEAGKDKDAQSAAGNAADAFQDGKGGKGDLNTELEKGMAEVGGLENAVVDPSKIAGAEDLDKKLDDAKKDSDKKAADQDPCKKPLSWECIGGKLVDGLIQLGMDVAGYYANGGAQGAWTMGENGVIYNKNTGKTK